MDKEYILIALLFGGAYVVSKYKKAAELAENLEYTYSGFSYDQQSNTQITLSFYLDVKNKNNKDISLKYSSLNCYLNSQYAGRAFLPYPQVLKAGQTTTVAVAVVIRYKEVFREFWNAFLIFSTSVNLVVSGSLRFEGVLVPIPAIKVASFNLNDAIQKIKNS